MNLKSPDGDLVQLLPVGQGFRSQKLLLSEKQPPLPSFDLVAATVRIAFR
jgi:hypothetical protein